MNVPYFTVLQNTQRRLNFAETGEMFRRFMKCSDIMSSYQVCDECSVSHLSLMFLFCYFQIITFILQQSDASLQTMRLVILLCAAFALTAEAGETHVKFLKPKSKSFF